jgi:hypothetical protein
MASVECRRRFPDAKFTHVRLKYWHEKAPAFSKRNDEGVRGEIAQLDYGWHAFREGVTTY